MAKTKAPLIVDILKEKSMQVPERPEGAMTSRELASALGIGLKKVYTLLDEMRLEGTLKEAKYIIRDANGRHKFAKLYWVEA